MAMRTASVLVLCLVGVLLATPASARDLGFGRPAFDDAVRQVGDVRTARFDPVACSARSAPARSKDWRFFIAPYGWLASVEGTLVAGGVETDVDVPFADLTEFVNGGFQLYTEIRWRKWFIAFDGTWAKLGTEAEGTLFDFGVDITQQIFDVRVGYEVFRKSRDGTLDPCCEGWRRWIIADVFAGVRYWYTKTQVDLEGRGPIGLERSLEGVDERWDPFVGARFSYAITRHWGLTLRGDIGGFGIGDAAQLTWQLQAGVSYSVTQWMHLFCGWRALAFDTVSGSGADRSGADLIQHGPLFGLGFSF